MVRHETTRQRQARTRREDKARRATLPARLLAGLDEADQAMAEMGWAPLLPENDDERQFWDF